MSSWRTYLGGRYSPFGTDPPPRSAPTVTEDDYHYLGPDDIVEAPRNRTSKYLSENAGYFSNNGRLGSRNDIDNPEAPDILVMKHRGTTYPLHFPAFAIGEGHLTVGELRKLAAQETKTSNARRIKLLYKGKTLKDDSVPCREEGLKQNSELMCVVSEAAVHGRSPGESSESADDDEMTRVGRENGVRTDVDGSTTGGKKKRSGHRGRKGKKHAKRDDSPAQQPIYQPQNGYNNGTASNSTRVDSTHNLDNGYTGNGTNSSRPDTPSQPNQAQTQRPKTPMDKLDELSSIFHNKFEPQCHRFLDRPPSDPKTRDMEYKKLGEVIMAQILLKLDEVEGNDEIKARRKALVRETQDVLNRLDAFMKK